MRRPAVCGNVNQLLVSVLYFNYQRSRISVARIGKKMKKRQKPDKAKKKNQYSPTEPGRPRQKEHIQENIYPFLSIPGELLFILKI